MNTKNVRNRTFSLLAALALMGGASTSNLYAQVNFKVTELQPLEEHLSSGAHRLNDYGVAVGSSAPTGELDVDAEAISWSAEGKAFRLADKSKLGETGGSFINNRGEIIGSYNNSSGCGFFVFKPKKSNQCGGSLEEIRHLHDSDCTGRHQPLSLNDSGALSGVRLGINSASAEGFVYYIRSNRLKIDNNFQYPVINNNTLFKVRQGLTPTFQSTDLAIESPAGVSQLLMPDGTNSLFGETVDANDRKTVVAEVSTGESYKCVMWQKNTIKPEPVSPIVIDTQGKDCLSPRVNNAGQVLFNTYSAAEDRLEAILMLENGALINLSKAIPQDLGITLTYVQDLNDVGQILVRGRNAQGRSRAFILTPAPENVVSAELIPFLGRYAGSTKEKYCPNDGSGQCFSYFYGPKFNVFIEDGKPVLTMKGRKFNVTIKENALVATRELNSKVINLSYELVLKPLSVVGDDSKFDITYSRVRTYRSGRIENRSQSGTAVRGSTTQCVIALPLK